jgi:hypothetical protein
MNVVFSFMNPWHMTLRTIVMYVHPLNQLRITLSVERYVLPVILKQCLFNSLKVEHHEIFSAEFFVLFFALR